MTVTTTDLGTATCRALMRDLDDKPVALQIYHSPGVYDYEGTTAAEATIARQWCVILFPLPDAISVRAHLKYWGMDIWDQAELSPGEPGLKSDYIFVRYPEDQAAITGPEFGAELRTAVDKALAAVEADRAKARADR